MLINTGAYDNDVLTGKKKAKPKKPTNILPEQDKVLNQDPAGRESKPRPGTGGTPFDVAKKSDSILKGDPRIDKALTNLDKKTEQKLKADNKRALAMNGMSIFKATSDPDSDALFTGDIDTMVDMSAIKPKDISHKGSEKTAIQNLQSDYTSLPGAMALYDVLVGGGEPTYGMGASKERNQFMARVKNPNGDIDHIHLAKQLYDQIIRNGQGRDVAISKLQASGLLDPNVIQAGALDDSDPHRGVAQATAKIMRESSSYFTSDETKTSKFIADIESKSGKLINHDDVIRDSAFGRAGLEKTFLDDVEDPDQFLRDAGVDDPKIRAIIRDNPNIMRGGNLSTYVQSLQGVVNPFSTLTNLRGVSKSDLSDAERAGIALGDFAFQAILGARYAGAENLLSGKNVGQTLLKFASIDNLLDAPDLYFEIEGKGLLDGSASFAASMISQYNPAILLDEESDIEAKTITAASLLTLGLGGAYGKFQERGVRDRMKSAPSLEEIQANGGWSSLPKEVRALRGRFVDAFMEASGGRDMPQGVNVANTDKVRLFDAADKWALLTLGQANHVYKGNVQIIKDWGTSVVPDKFKELADEVLKKAKEKSNVLNSQIQVNENSWNQGDQSQVGFDGQSANVTDDQINLARKYASALGADTGVQSIDNGKSITETGSQNSNLDDDFELVPPSDKPTFGDSLTNRNHITDHFNIDWSDATEMDGLSVFHGYDRASDDPVMVLTDGDRFIVGDGADGESWLLNQWGANNTQEPDAGSTFDIPKGKVPVWDVENFTDSDMPAMSVPGSDDVARYYSNAKVWQVSNAKDPSTDVQFRNAKDARDWLIRKAKGDGVRPTHLMDKTSGEVNPFGYETESVGDAGANGSSNRAQGDSNEATRPIKLNVGGKELTYIGDSEDGDMVFVDSEGVRTKRSPNGILSTEPVAISPSKSGFGTSVDRTGPDGLPGREDYWTKDEAAKVRQSADAQKGSGNSVPDPSQPATPERAKILGSAILRAHTTGGQRAAHISAIIGEDKSKFEVDKKQLDRLTPDQYAELVAMYVRAVSANEKYVDTMSQIAESLGGSLEVGPIKRPNRVIDKWLSKQDANGDLTKVRDVLRSTVIVTGVENVLQAGSKVREMMDIQVENGKERYKDWYTDRQPNYYAHILTNTIIDGVVTEIQINDPRMVDAKHRAHKFYVESETAARQLDSAIQSGNSAKVAKLEKTIIIAGQSMIDIYRPAYELIVSGSDSFRNESSSVGTTTELDSESNNRSDGYDTNLPDSDLKTPSPGMITNESNSLAQNDDPSGKDTAETNLPSNIGASNNKDTTDGKKVPAPVSMYSVGDEGFVYPWDREGVDQFTWNKSHQDEVDIVGSQFSFKPYRGGPYDATITDKIRVGENDLYTIEYNGESPAVDKVTRDGMLYSDLIKHGLPIPNPNAKTSAAPAEPKQPTKPTPLTAQKVRDKAKQALVKDPTIRMQALANDLVHFLASPDLNRVATDAIIDMMADNPAAGDVLSELSNDPNGAVMKVWGTYAHKQILKENQAKEQAPTTKETAPQYSAAEQAVLDRLETLRKRKGGLKPKGGKQLGAITIGPEDFEQLILEVAAFAIRTKKSIKEAVKAIAEAFDVSDSDIRQIEEAVIEDFGDILETGNNDGLLPNGTEEPEGVPEGVREGTDAGGRDESGSRRGEKDSGRSPRDAGSTNVEGRKSGSGQGVRGSNSAPSGRDSSTRDGEGTRDADGSNDGQRRAGTNFRLPQIHGIAERSVSGKRRQLLEALQAMTSAKARGFATVDEQSAIAAFPGWGFDKAIFDPSTSSGRTKIAGEIRELLSVEQKKRAIVATKNSHFTDPVVVDAMWKGLEQLGFNTDKNTKVLETSAGSGLFFTAQPEHLRGNQDWTFIEKDATSAEILQYVMPESDVRAHGIEAKFLEEDHYDVVISNVPFLGGSETSIYDPQLIDKYGADFADRIVKAGLHNYFFAKAVDALKPGGVAALITTHHTMDAASRQWFREWISEQADFLGAIRLPSSAFDAQANTEVVTDVIYLRKKGEGLPEVPNRSWVETSQRKIDKMGVITSTWFKDNKQYILGKEAMSGTMNRQNEYNVEPRTKDIESALNDALAQMLPENAFDPRETKKPKSEERKAAPEHVQIGQLYIGEKGEIYKKNPYGVEEPAGVSAKNVPMVKQYLNVSNALADVMAHQSGTDADLKKAQAKLDKEYKAFVKKFGEFHKNTYKDVPVVDVTEIDGKKVKEALLDEDGSPVTEREYTFVNRKILSIDSQYPRVFALERFNAETGEVQSLADVFSMRVVRSSADSVTADNPVDAMNISMNLRGRIDLGFMHEISGIPVDELKSGIESSSFTDPGTGDLLTSDSYLSGNVVKKLREAEKEVESGNTEFQRNVDALTKVQPPRMKYGEFNVSLGASWIPPKVVQEWIKQKFATEATVTKASNGWDVSIRMKGRGLIELSNELGAQEHIILNNLINNQPTNIYTLDENRNRVIDPEATAEATEYIRSMRDEFVVAVDSSAAAQKLVEDAYNEIINVYQVGEFDGSNLTFPGLADMVQLRPHRVNAISRAMQEPFTLWWHGVGSGKTFTAAMLANKLKQTGLRNKPVLVTYKPTHEQIVNDMYAAYPSANILAASDDSFSKGKREEFLAMIALGDWDLVVITKEQLSRLMLSPEVIQRTYDAQIDQMTAALGQMESEEKGSRKLKQLAKEIESLEAKRDKLIDDSRKTDPMFYFDRSGIDHIIIDEAHFFKGVPTASRQQLNHSTSARAVDLMAKADYLRSINGGMTAMTGTAIVNSMAEIYNWMRYLNPTTLKDAKMENFDDFSRQYAVPVTEAEVHVSGSTVTKTRLKKLINLPELAKMISRNIDVIPSREVASLKIPVLMDMDGTVTNKPIVIITKPNLSLQIYFKRLTERFKALKKRPEKGDPNILSLSSEARMASQDLRLIEDSDFDREGKVATMVDNVVKVYKDPKYAKHRATQALFVDWGTPGSKTQFTSFDLYADIKSRLIKSGVKASEIAFITDAKTPSDRIALSKRVNSGQVRIIIGSRAKMGVGMNIQERMIAAHHFDVGWNPAMIEQGNGRILRDGNMFYDPEGKSGVMVFMYVNQGTFDQVTTNKTFEKGNVIDQFMQAMYGVESGLREIDDVTSSEGAISLEEVRAASMGDPRIIDLFQKLKSLKSAKVQQELHNRSVNIAKAQLKKIPVDVNTAQNEISFYTEVLETFDPTVKSVSSHSTGNKTEFKDDTEFRAAIKEEIVGALKFATSGYWQSREVQIKVGNAVATMNFNGRSGGVVVQINQRVRGATIETTQLFVENADRIINGYPDPDFDAKANKKKSAPILFDKMEAPVLIDFNSGDGKARVQRYSMISFEPRVIARTLLDTPIEAQKHIDFSRERIEQLSSEYQAFEVQAAKPDTFDEKIAALKKETDRLVFVTGADEKALQTGVGGFGDQQTIVTPVEGKTLVLSDQSSGGVVSEYEILEENSTGMFWVKDADGNEFPVRPPGSAKVLSKDPVADESKAPSSDSDEMIVGPALTPDELEGRISSLIDITKGIGTQVRLADIKYKEGAPLGKFKHGDKKRHRGLVQTREALSRESLPRVIAHELGHAIDANLSEKRGLTHRRGIKSTGQLDILFDIKDKEQYKAVIDELREVTIALVGQDEYDSKKPYYGNKKELFARFLEAYIYAPQIVDQNAPMFRSIFDGASKENESIADFLRVVEGKTLHEVTPMFMPDKRQSRMRDLGDYVGTKTYASEVAYRARWKHAVIEAERIIKEKRKGVKDDPEILFDVAESIRHWDTEADRPVFGTRVFEHIDMDSFAEHNDALAEHFALMAQGFWYTGEDENGVNQYERWRVHPGRGERLFNSLSPEGKALIRDYTIDKSETSELFNRHVLASYTGVTESIEGYVRHFFEDKTLTPGTARMKQKKADFRKHRAEAEGYSKDFFLAANVNIEDALIEEAQNKFIAELYALTLNKYDPETMDLPPDHVVVEGNTLIGFMSPGDRVTKILKDDGTLQRIKVGQTYMVHKTIFDEYITPRKLMIETKTAIDKLTEIGSFGVATLLVHTGTFSTNAISGAIQLSTKFLKDFYSDVLYGQVRMPRTRANFLGVAQAIHGIVTKNQNQYAWGGDRSTLYRQYSGQIENDRFGRKALDFTLKPMSGIENFFKQIVYNQTVNQMNPTDEMSREFLAAVNDQIDMFTYDYDNIPNWLNSFRKHPAGALVKPFAVYPYKYMKQLTRLAGAAFDPNLSWQERLSSILSLTTVIALWKMYKESLKDDDQRVGKLPDKLPEGVSLDQLTGLVDSRGRTYVGRDAAGNEVFLRTAKYPFVNIAELIEALYTGNPEGALDILKDQVSGFGPAGGIVLSTLGYSDEFSRYQDLPTKLTNSATALIPGSRLAKDIGDVIDPLKRDYPNTPNEVLGKLVPVFWDVSTWKALGNELVKDGDSTTLSDDDFSPTLSTIRGKQRTTKVYLDPKARGRGRSGKTMEEVKAPKFARDELLFLFFGLRLKRINPDYYEHAVRRKIEIAEEAKDKEENSRSRGKSTSARKRSK